ncbi:tetratricopeptide repeat protein [Microcoleus sp. ARI1-B5]|uniref:DUF2225 domain-containing protein n=1 Tax=unclassified Microcoleus TaxID=2642155 RepID=UPI002FD4C398
MSEFEFLQHGVDCFNQKNYEEAIEAFDRVLQINPNLAEAYYLRGLARSQLGDTRGAIGDYDLALQINPEWVDVYRSRASAHTAFGNQQGAVEDYTQVLRINPLEIEAYINRSLARTRLGDNREAIEDCTKAIRLNPNYAEAYVNRGLARSNLRNLKGALEDWTQALAIAPDDAQAYSNRCFVRAELGEPQGALEDCNRALQINPEFDQAYTNRGFVRSQVGDYQGALEDCQQSLQLNPNEPETYYHRATARYYSGNRQGAIEDSQKAADLYVQQGRTDDYHYQAALDNIKQLELGATLMPPTVSVADETQVVDVSINSRQAEADSLLRQGLEQSQTNQLDAALASYRQALTIYREVEDTWGVNLAILALQNLGNMYRDRGQEQYENREFEASLNSYQQALSIYRISGDRAGECNVLYNLGIAYDIFNRYEKAIEYFQQSLDLAREIGDRSFQGRILGSLGISLGRRDSKTSDDSQKIIDCHQESLRIALEISDLRGQSLALENIGNFWALQEDYNSAIDYYQQSLAKAQEIGDAYGEMFAVGNIGAVYLYQENYNQAIEYFQQGLKIAKEYKEWQSEAINLERLGLAFFKAKNLREAESYLNQAIEVYETTWAGNGNNDREKTSMLDMQLMAYLVMQEVLIEQQRFEDALEISDRGRARAIAELLERQLSSSQPKLSPKFHLTIEGIKNVAKSQKSTLVEYTIINDYDGTTEAKLGQSKLFIWVIKPTGEIDFRSVDLKPLLQGRITSLEKLVSNYRGSIGARGLNRKAVVDKEETVPADPVERSQELYRILIEDIADLLPTNVDERVIFIPQGSLFLVPFPALKNESGKYLIEQHTILTATSIKVLELTHEQQERVQAVGMEDMLVVGNPTMPSISFEFGQKPEKLDSLPGAEKEALDIASLLHAQALIGNAATKVAVVKRMPSSRIIHLATHGLLEDFRKQEVPGAIVLAPSATDDGLLTAAEILEFKLNAELVVLSACDTGQGRLTGDGAIGLSRSLIAAGVPSVIVSLWSVPDASTALLMVEFYQNLDRNSDKAQALRQAMLTIIKEYPNPINWAAFTLIGEANSAFSFATTGKLVGVSQ